MRSLGVISGTVLLNEKKIRITEEKYVETEFGTALVLISDNFIYIPRHGKSGDSHILPHIINHQANLKALKNLGVKEVIGINSTGSLKKTLKPGMLLVPDDFIALSGTPTTVTEKALHIIPALDERVRRKIIDSADNCKIDVIKGGIYWQTTGPRLETKAEIRMMAGHADIVGMTMASEAVVACELNIPYASICSIDNYCHGIAEKQLTLREITKGAKRNTDTILNILERYIEGQDDARWSR